MKKKQMSQRIKNGAKPAAKSPATKPAQNPVQSMLGKAQKAMGGMQKGRTSMWDDYKRGYDANQGKLKK